MMIYDINKEKSLKKLNIIQKINFFITIKKSKQLQIQNKKIKNEKKTKNLSSIRTIKKPFNFIILINTNFF